MLPIVFNEDRSRLVQLTMNGSVGAGGGNDKSDVVLVQTLLNAVPSGDAGPEDELAVDGLVGPLTIGAIQRYQQAHTTVVDGRVDVGGPTIMALVRGLNARNALPQGLPNLGQPKPEIIHSLWNQTPVFSRSRLDRECASSASRPSAQLAKVLPVTGAAAAASTLFGPTGWNIVTSGSFDVSVLIIGVTVINIYMTHDTEPGLTYRFSFAGSGVGLSLIPIGMDVSFAEMPSWGTSVRKVPSPLAKNPPFNANEFDLLPTTILSVAFNAGPGWSGTLIFFGSIGPLLVTSRYVAALTGMQAGIPGPNAALYVGAIAGWT